MPPHAFTHYRDLPIGKSGFGYYVIGRDQWLGYYPTLSHLIGAIDFAMGAE
jgi:hypothetical protein